jgi:hypothetical protein
MYTNNVRERETEIGREKMFVIREVNERKANPYYYNSMIGGMIVHVDESRSEAMEFGTKEEAEAELEKYNIFLKSFEVQGAS